VGSKLSISRKTSPTCPPKLFIVLTDKGQTHTQKATVWVIRTMDMKRMRKSLKIDAQATEKICEERSKKM
jgi:hypothetical protein